MSDQELRTLLEEIALAVRWEARATRKVNLSPKPCCVRL
jgi:hypothetical protein